MTDPTADAYWTVFTKPWPQTPLPDLARLVADLDVHGVELPVRPGFQVEPATAERDLPTAGRIFADLGLRVADVAGPAEERVLAACAEAGVPMVRIMLPFGGRDFRTTADESRRLLDTTLPLCEKYDVALGIQPHQDQFTSTGVDLWNLLRDYDSPLLGAAWDAGHEGLAGQVVEHSLSILWDRLHLVNMKNALYREVSPGSVPAKWETFWTTAQAGLCDWARVVDHLVAHGYSGPLCLCAEYDFGDTAELVRQDLAYGRALVAAARESA